MSGDQDKLAEIRGRWQYFLDDTWAHADRQDRVTGNGAKVFAPVLKDVLCVVKHDAAGPGVSIIVAAVPDTAPLVQEALVHAPADLKYLLDLVESGRDVI